VANANFLYPTLVSALQVEGQLDPRRETLLIFLMGVDEPTIQAVRTACAGKHVHFLKLDASLLGLPSDISLVPGHVPAESLGRLVLHRVLDPIYDRVLYLDGDTLILGNIRPLLDHEPPAGTIGAVRDLVWLTRCCDRAAARDWWERYASEIGLKDPDAYFNAGVLSFRRDDMQEISDAALQFFIENSGQCQFHDQSALNTVCNERLTELWPGFNYHGPYQELIPVAVAKPAIVHFTGPVKPWVFRVRRFARFAEIYDRFDADNPSLAGYRRQAPLAEQRRTSRWLMRRATKQKLWFWIWFSKVRKLHAYLGEFVLADTAVSPIARAAVEKSRLASARRMSEQDQRPRRKD
jgi:hypothetical protein